MIIIKKDRSASIPQTERLIGFENDHLVEKRLFYVVDPSLNGFTFKLDVENTSDIVSLTPVTDSAIDALLQESGETPSGVLLQWDITRGVLEDGGIITVQLRAFDTEGKHIWHSEKMDFIAGTSVKATEEASSEATLTEFEQIEMRVDKALADVDAAKGDITDKYNEIVQLGDAYQEAMENVGTLEQETAAHYADKDNPHEVTAEQVGTYKKAEIDAKTAPFEEHLKDFSNPHLVTSEQIGTYSKAEIDAQAEVTAKALEDANSEIAAKLTKITEFYPVDRVYGVNMAGEQVMLEAHRDFNSDGGIPVYDNNGVIKTGTPAKDTDSVNKKYVDDKAVGKLDKVKSDFILYPGIYATTDTDGTPYLMTATSDLGYIGKGSGYIATYDGGELKTGTPTSDDSAANKAYVDEKAKVSDVKVAGTSVVADGNANIPNVLALGDDGKLRVANAPDKTKWTGPFGVDNTGLLVTAGPNNIVIDNRTASSIQFLNCAYLDYAVKAAMCDGKGPAWTDTEKAAARERMGIKDYKLLATLNFTENASTFTLTTLNGQPIALKSMVVIMNRIGDEESANGHITPVFTVKGANGASTNIKGGYFYGVGANGNCWYTRAEISGEFFDSESACMAPSTNSQLGNGWMTTELSKNMDWRNLSDDFLPITQITGFKIIANGNCITNGSTMWIYGREE